MDQVIVGRQVAPVGFGHGQDGGGETVAVGSGNQVKGRGAFPRLFEIDGDKIEVGGGKLPMVERVALCLAREHRRRVSGVGDGQFEGNVAGEGSGTGSKTSVPAACSGTLPGVTGTVMLSVNVSAGAGPQ